MKPDLKYDPRTKQNIKDMLHSYLYEPVIRKFQERLAAIITANSNALGSSHGSFIYRNEVYQLNEQERLPRKMNRLIPALHDQMDEYSRYEVDSVYPNDNTKEEINAFASRNRATPYHPA